MLDTVRKHAVKVLFQMVEEVRVLSRSDNGRVKNQIVQRLYG